MTTPVFTKILDPTISIIVELVNTSEDGTSYQMINWRKL